MCTSKKYTAYQKQTNKQIIQIEEKNGSSILQLNENMEKLKNYRIQITPEKKKKES